MAEYIQHRHLPTHPPPRQPVAQTRPQVTLHHPHLRQALRLHTPVQAPLSQKDQTQHAPIPFPHAPRLQILTDSYRIYSRAETEYPALNGNGIFRDAECDDTK